MYYGSEDYDWSPLAVLYIDRTSSIDWSTISSRLDSSALRGNRPDRETDYGMVTVEQTIEQSTFRAHSLHFFQNQTIVKVIRYNWRHLPSLIFGLPR